MSSTAAYTAIKDYLVATFGGSYSVYDWEEIETQTQHNSTPFLALDGGAGTGGLVSVGSPAANWQEDIGVWVIHVFGPAGSGLAPVRGLADQVRTSLQYHYFSQGAGETLRVIAVDPPSGGVINDGLWSSMLVSVSYEHKYAIATA